MRTILFSMATVVAISAAAATGLATAADAPPVPYPKGYRDWHHVKSMVINPGHGLYESFGGIHHLYANKAALQGYETGKWPDGALIVFDLFEAKTADNVVTEGPRKVVGVMYRDARKYAATGGWGYEGFKGNSKTDRAVGGNALTACHQCHAAQKDSGYVFSKLRP